MVDAINSDTTENANQKVLENSIVTTLIPRDWKKYSYVYIVMMVLNNVGIDRMSKVLKAIAKVQKDLDKVMDSLNDLKKLLQELQNQPWGFEHNADGSIKKDAQGNPISWDPAKHSAQENQDQMQKQICAWLSTKDSAGVTNLQKIQNTWKTLYGSDPKKTGGLLGQLKTDLCNPFYNQGTDGAGYQQFKDMQNDPAFNGSDWQVTDGGKKLNFLDVLDGNVKDPIDASFVMTKAFCASYYNKTGIKPATGGQDKYDDSVGTVTDLFEQDKQTLNGLNTTESSDLSMYSQNLTSEIQEGQQMIQYGGQETKAYVNNQQGR